MNVKWKTRLIAAFRRAIGANLGILLKDGTVIFFIFVVFSALALAGSWIADGLYLIFVERRISAGAGMLICSILIMTALGILIRKAVGDLSFKVSEDDKPSGKKVLILFLSSLGNDKLKIVKTISNMEDFKNYQDKDYISWEMPMQAIAYHVNRGALERVEVITSPQSAEQFDEFKELVHRVFPQYELEISNNPVSDFEKVAEVYEKVESVIRALNRASHGKKYKDSDMIIDVTGGQKPATIAGVLASVYHFMEVQYVSTRTKKVRAYYVEPAN